MISKNKSFIKILSLCIVLTGCITYSVQAENAYNRLLVRWKTERMGLLRRITCTWLRGNDPRGVQNDLFALSRIESGLATKPGTMLYVSEIATPENPEAGAGDVVRVYLKKRHILTDTTALFRNRSFSLTREVSIPVAAAVPPPTFTGTRPAPEPVQADIAERDADTSHPDPYQTRYVKVAR